MSKIIYQPKKFAASSLIIIVQANTIVEAYAAQGLRLTLRQLYYRFVAQAFIANHQKEYKRLGSIINDARLAGLLSWDAIEDRGRNLNRFSMWSDPSSIIGSCVSSYLTDRWRHQDVRLEVWVEKQALEAVIEDACEPFDVPSIACKGYMSQSEMWRAAQRFLKYQRAGKRTTIIHLGDHDPSGIDMTRDIFDRLNKVFGTKVKVDRIALNMDQVEELNPPPNPAKMTDARFASYSEEFGDESWELDAIEPASLNDLITAKIRENMDAERWDESTEKMEEERSLLESCSDRWDEVVDLLS